MTLIGKLSVYYGGLESLSIRLVVKYAKIMITK